MYNSWDDIKLHTYIEIIDIMGDEYDDDEMNLQLVSLILDKSIDEVEQMEYDEYSDVINNIGFMNDPITPNNDTELLIEGEIFHLLDFNMLELGAFIDMEHLFNSDRYVFNLPKIFSILYRRELTPMTKFDKPKHEKYSDWLDIREVLFEDIKITNVYGVISKYLTFRSDIYKTYEGLFQEKEDFDDDDSEYTKGMTTKELEAYQMENNVSKWSWELLLMKICNNDPLGIDKATEMPIIQALNILSMLRELKIG